MELERGMAFAVASLASSWEPGAGRGRVHVMSSASARADIIFFFRLPSLIRLLRGDGRETYSKTLGT